MDYVLTLVDQYPRLLAAIAALAVTIIAIVIWWERVAFWWLRVTMNFPVIGKISRLSKRFGYDGRTHWFQSERELCAEFQPYYADVDRNEDFFDNCRSYLRKAQELGRKPLSAFGWVLIAVMVFIEALGFSYVLAGYTIPGVSEELKQQAALGIALLVSIILVAFTHHTGHELHQNSLVKKVRAWRTNGADLHPNTQVSLDKEQADDNDPAWRQLLSRLNSNSTVTPSFKITIPTIAMVILIAIGATYVRGQVLEKELTEQHQLQGSASNAADPYGALPSDLTSAQQSVDNEVDKESENADRKGGWATFIVLAVIFLFLQILGVLFGYKSGFAGRESLDAYQYSGRFRTREQFANFYERKRNVISQIAQRNLEKLQGKMAKRAHSSHTDGAVMELVKQTGERTFYQYATEDAYARASHDVHLSQAKTAREEAIRSQTAAAAAAKAAAEPVRHVEPEVIPAGPVVAEAPAPVAVAHTDIPEAEIQQWMEKLGWDRDRTVALLEKHYEEERRKKAVSEEEALALLKAQAPAAVSEEEALALLRGTPGEPT